MTYKDLVQSYYSSAIWREAERLHRIHTHDLMSQIEIVLELNDEKFNWKDSSESFDSFIKSKFTGRTKKILTRLWKDHKKHDKHLNEIIDLIYPARKKSNG